MDETITPTEMADWMCELTSAVLKNKEKLFIEKAYNWLQDNIESFVSANYDEVELMIEKFKEAMEE